LTPLFGTLGRRVINAGTVQLFNTLFGQGFMPDECYVAVNGYPYLQMRFTLKSMWQMLIGLMRPSVWRIMWHVEARWRDEAHPRYVTVIERWQAHPLRQLPAADLLTGTRELLGEAVHTYTVLQSGVIGIAMSAEAGFAAFYDKLVKRRTDPPAPTFLLGFDSLPILAEKSLYDVAQACRERPALADHVAHTPTAQLIAQLAEESIPPGLAENDWHEWQRHFREHLARSGTPLTISTSPSRRRRMLLHRCWMRSKCTSRAREPARMNVNRRCHPARRGHPGYLRAVARIAPEGVPQVARLGAPLRPHARG
jgi:pyruvate,water dikinase